MRKLFLLMVGFVLLFTFVGCSESGSTEIPTSTNIPSPTATITPTQTPRPTRTPIPTQTPRRELTAADVGLSIGPEVGSFVYKKCYVWTDTHFHAGDIIYFEFGYSPTEYIIYAPIDGTIRFADKISVVVGWEIRVETPFVYNGETVWYELVHHDGLVNGITIGSFVRRGEPIARLFTARNNGRIEKMVDMGIRNGLRGPQPGIEPFHPESYLNVFLFVEDDLALRNVTYETCTGNPIP